MIQVNLLPERVRTAEAIRTNVMMGVVLLAVMAGAVGFAYAQKKSTLRVVRKQIAQVRAEMDSPGLKKVVQAVGEFTAQRQELDTQQSTINGLRVKQVGLIKVMDILPDLLPPRLWFTDLLVELDKGGVFKVTVKGQASSPQEVANFFTNLENRGAFKSVKMDSCCPTATNLGVSLVNYTITFQYEPS